MRKTVFAVLAVFVTLAMLAPPALAQAPAPKVTISGFVDNVSSWSKNMSITDANYDITRDDSWYARTRLRPDLTAEVGSTKFVLGLEMDYSWGGPQGEPYPSATAGADLNTDMAGIIELKWGYTEFNIPFIEGSRIRLGAQPFDTTYKTAVLAHGDFAGFHFTWGATPGVRLNATFAQIEESVTGAEFGFDTGSDQAWIFSVDISPFRGLDLRPIVSGAFFNGPTSESARQGRGGVDTGAFVVGDEEQRYTIGVDARWKAGPYYLDPTILFQFGERDFGAIRNQKRQAVLLDVRGGWQGGPLLVEGALIYTTGNKADDDIAGDADEDLKFYEPIDTDTSYYGGWANVFALGIDYFNILYGTADTAGLNPGVAIGYDKYGLFRVGARGSYAMTPAFAVNAAATQSWTAEKVDTGSTLGVDSGLTPGGGAEKRNLGFEVDLGFTWRFAPNVALDVIGAYLYAGKALANTAAPDPDDVQTIAGRVRYTF
jgi:hypothetical protein